MSAGGLVQALQATVHHVLGRLDAELASLELGASEINLLAQFRDPGRRMAVAELTTRTGQRPSTITGVLDRLERRKLIERELNPRDRRSFLVSLTAAGGQAALSVAEVLAAIEDELATRVSAEELAGFHAVLAGLAADRP